MEVKQCGKKFRTEMKQIWSLLYQAIAVRLVESKTWRCQAIIINERDCTLNIDVCF